MYMIALAGPFYIMYNWYHHHYARAIPGNIVTHLYLTYDTPCDPNVDLEAGITDHRQPPSHHWVTGRYHMLSINWYQVMHDPLDT